MVALFGRAARARGQSARRAEHVPRPHGTRRRCEPHAGGAHGSSQELRLPLVLDPGARGAQVLRSMRRGRSAGDPRRADAVLRAAPGARQGEADPDPRRRGRGAQLPAQRRAAHRRPQRPARLPGRPVRLARSTRTSSTGTASSSCATRGRSTASSCACGAPSRSSRATIPRRRAALPARRDPEGERRPRARRHVLLLVAEAPEPLPDHAGPPGRARRAWSCARAAAASRSAARGAT